jgi:putative ABC transport system permease protein
MKALLLDAMRGVHARRWPTLVATSGLTLALTACLLLALLAIALAAPEPGVPDPDQVVVLGFKGNPPGQPRDWATYAPGAFADMLKQRQVPLDQISRLIGNGIDIDHDGGFQPAYKIIADPDLVSVLGLKALHGDLRASLERHDGIAITTDLVRKLWGELPPPQALGRTLTSRGTVYTVSAVIANPDPQGLLGANYPLIGNAMAMVGYDTQGNTLTEEERKAIFVMDARIFARLRPGTRIEQIGGWMHDAFVANPLYAKLPADWTAGREAAYFRAIRLTELPFNGELNQLRWSVLGVLAAASVLLLGLAAFNNMNLQTASLLQRQRETALRRALGADSAQLLRLWAMEALLPLLLSAAVALLLAWWLAPLLANIVELSPVRSLTDPMPLLALLGLVAAVLLLLPVTLALPAWMALRRAPAPALQGRTASEGPWGRRIRQALLTLQLGGALLLLSLAGVMTMQQHHLLHADRGYDTRNRLYLGVAVNPDMVPNMDAFTAALSHHPAVTSWAFSGAQPAADTEGQVELYSGAAQLNTRVRVTEVSPSFFETYGMTVLAGKPSIGLGEPHVVIDAKAAQALGFARPQDAVGALLHGGGGFMQAGSEPRRVVAVIKDVKLESAREPAMAQAFVLSDKTQWDLTIFGPDLAVLREVVEELWKAHGPRLLHETESLDQQRAGVYRTEERLTTLLAVIALLTVWVAMLGAYALVADTLRRRRTELVLHRLHGAGHIAILRQVAAEFSGPLLIAALVGLPLAVVLGQLYLQGYVDRVDLTSGLVLPLLAAALATAMVTALAALRHVQLALALQPVEVLR